MYNPGMIRPLVLAAAAAALLSGCASRDVKTDLEVLEVATGWYDLGIVADGEHAGKNKLVPSVSLQLKNISQLGISGVQLDAVFRNVKDVAVIGEHFVPGVPSNVTLEPGATTPPIVLRAKVGFVGTETRTLMLQNSVFKDAEVTILLRHGRNNWVTMKVIPIERKLLTR